MKTQKRHPSVYHCNCRTCTRNTYRWLTACRTFVTNLELPDTRDTLPWHVEPRVTNITLTPRRAGTTKCTRSLGLNNQPFGRKKNKFQFFFFSFVFFSRVDAHYAFRETDMTARAEVDSLLVGFDSRLIDGGHPRVVLYDAIILWDQFISFSVPRLGMINNLLNTVSLY